MCRCISGHLDPDPDGAGVLVVLGEFAASEDLFHEGEPNKEGVSCPEVRVLGYAKV